MHVPRCGRVSRRAGGIAGFRIIVERWSLVGPRNIGEEMCDAGDIRGALMEGGDWAKTRSVHLCVLSNTGLRMGSSAGSHDAKLCEGKLLAIDYSAPAEGHRRRRPAARVLLNLHIPTT